MAQDFDSTNYARTSASVLARRRDLVEQNHILAGIIVAVVCVVVALVLSIVPSIVSQNRIEAMADDFVSDIAEETVDAGDAGADGVVDGGEGGGLDWNALLGATGGRASAWISVPSKGIDFAVAKWWDNEYGLHHDVYGNWSWAGVFLDADADADGRNRVIYGHTLYGGGMFSPLSEARYQSVFDSIGTVSYSTPAQGWRDYTPVACLNVDPSDTEVREFTFAPSPDDIEAASRKVLAEHARNGKYNTVLRSALSSKSKSTAKTSSEATESDSKAVSAENGTGTGTDAKTDVIADEKRRDYDIVDSRNEIEEDVSFEVAPGRWWVLTDDEISEITHNAEVKVWRNWATGLANRASSGRADAVDIINRSEESVVLACCSWPFNNHRTLVLAVR